MQREDDCCGCGGTADRDPEEEQLQRVVDDTLAQDFNDRSHHRLNTNSLDNRGSNREIRYCLMHSRREMSHDRTLGHVFMKKRLGRVSKSTVEKPFARSRTRSLTRLHSTPTSHEHRSKER